MRERDASPESPMLQRATELLREIPDVRAEWRAALNARIRQPSFNVRVKARDRSTLRPFAAIAAALVFAGVGIGAALAVRAPGQTTENGLSRTRFAFVAPSASQVSIVGDFNQWNPAAFPLRRSADGRTWVIEVSLRSGRHVYAFVVDGKVARDPTAAEGEDDGLGMPNSVVVVQGT